MNGMKIVFTEHKKNLKNIWSMALKDLKKEYSGTVMGYAWSVLKNLIFVAAYWFTIEIGLKGSKDVGYPYMAWLVTGLGAWFLIRDTLAPASKAIRKNKFLVTKFIYPISIIPTTKVVSAFISSLMFLPIIILILLGSGVDFKIYWIQIFYYQMALLVLMTGISLLSSALVVISRDIEMLINSTVFVLFWISPVLFPLSNIDSKLAFILKLNPFIYIIEGFRGAFLYGEWFWERPVLTIYFWIIAIGFVILGSFVHGRLRNQFVDVL